jgi:hypothetical protein
MACHINLPDGWGNAVLRKRHERRPGAAYSYDHLGHQLTWSPAQIAAKNFACDMEQHGRDSARIAARFGMSQRQFLRAWVLTEVLAKLLDVPILSWLKLHGLAVRWRGEVELVELIDVRVYGALGTATTLVKECGQIQRTMAFGVLTSTVPCACMVCGFDVRPNGCSTSRHTSPLSAGHVATTGLAAAAALLNV